MSYNHTKVYGEKPVAIMKLLIENRMSRIVCFGKEHRIVLPTLASSHERIHGTGIYVHIEADDELTVSKKRNFWEKVPYSNRAIALKLNWPIQELSKVFAEDEPFYVCKTFRYPEDRPFDELMKDIEDFYSLHGFLQNSDYYIAHPRRYIYPKKPVPLTLRDFRDFKNELSHPTLKGQLDPIKAEMKKQVIMQLIEQMHAINKEGYTDIEIGRRLRKQWEDGSNEVLEFMKQDLGEYPDLLLLINDWRHYYFQDY